ncbi:hypothetical protein SAY86_015248 [Trapa natans]|uniref:Protein NBR1 homolog n=1 Tax=Trapa natans TaxID=22666 RepID=A0AAN7KMN4_TRANT|nr:hypothetical protein SAY86_015248 [Trapa natans]
MDSTLVIKVQYGDTLRRFNAPLNQNGILELDMLNLKEKIFSLFDFPSGTVVTLTYIDEDGDTVTLVNDDDLRDVMKQQLKYLRITVKTEMSGRSYALSSGRSTPMRSPSIQLPIPNVDVLADVVKSCPESLHDALSKLSIDLLSKAINSSPTIIKECLENLMMVQSCTHPVSHARFGSSASNASLSTVADGTKDAGTPPNVLPKKTCDSSSSKNLCADFVAATSGTCQDGTSPHFPIDLNVDPTVKSLSLNDPKEYQKYNDNVIHGQVAGKPGSTCCPIGPPEITDVPKWNSSPTMEFSGSSVACPFSELPIQNEANMRRVRRVGCKPTDASGGVFHRGICCDGCGVNPITGPRYKSLVKDDYDLCSICFTEIGRPCDYICMDRPISYRHVRGSKPFPQSFGPPPPLPLHPISFPPTLKRGQPKLDSRFVSDVTIIDGTVMAPSTHFTKIWRMRNNGSYVWASGTRLVWIGCDNFSKNDSIELEIPPEGIPVNGELDIALDFVAPSSPGRYISYWRMASPSGHKFGQRVWVLIHVDAMADFGNTARAINLNLPPEATLHEVNCGVDGFFPATTPSAEPKLIVKEQQGKDEEQNFPINDALLVGDGAYAPVPPPESYSPISYPSIDPMVDVAAASVSTGPLPAFDKEAMELSGDTSADSDSVEQNLLKELAEMGFKQVDLNKEVLRMNTYDLQQSVDDLCGVSEWDPILEELHEMGFRDKEINKKLLKKNGGSIRRVVMDLLTGENV